MKIIIIFAFLFLIALIPNSEAKVNLEGMSLLSDDGNLVIDFGNNIIKQTKSKITTTPTLDFGIIQTVNQDYFLDFSDNLSVKVYGNSFVIKSFDEPLLIYAHNTGSNNYQIKVLTIANGFQKQSFTGVLEPIAVSEDSQLDFAQEELPEMKLLVKHTDRVFWKDSYYFTARVFDASLNPFNEFYQNWGFIPGIDILVEIFNRENKLLTSFSGNTSNTGYFEDQFYIVENLTPRGTYSVNITADNGQFKLTQTLPLFIFDKRSDGASNSTGP